MNVYKQRDRSATSSILQDEPKPKSEPEPAASASSPVSGTGEEASSSVLRIPPCALDECPADCRDLPASYSPNNTATVVGGNPIDVAGLTSYANGVGHTSKRASVAPLVSDEKRGRIPKPASGLYACTPGSLTGTAWTDTTASAWSLHQRQVYITVPCDLELGVHVKVCRHHTIPRIIWRGIAIWCHAAKENCMRGSPRVMSYTR